MLRTRSIRVGSGGTGHDNGDARIIWLNYNCSKRSMANVNEAYLSLGQVRMNLKGV